MYVSGSVLGHKETVVREADMAPVFTKLIAYWEKADKKT